MSGVQMLPLNAVQVDDRCWPRESLDQGRVEEFARLYLDEGPLAVDPVQVVQPLSGVPLLVNGRHRHAARSLIKAADIAVVVLDHGSQDPLDFAYDYALADSARSALPLTRAEKHRAVLRLLAEHPERTNVAIAGLVGVSSKTVQRARQWLAEHPNGVESGPVERPAPRVATADDVAHAMVRQLDRLWTARPLGMAVGLSDTARLGDLIGEAFVDQVGPEQAVTWTERMTTWATHAHAVARQAAEASA